MSPSVDDDCGVVAGTLATTNLATGSDLAVDLPALALASARDRSISYRRWERDAICSTTKAKAHPVMIFCWRDHQRRRGVLECNEQEQIYQLNNGEFF